MLQRGFNGKGDRKSPKQHCPIGKPAASEAFPYVRRCLKGLPVRSKMRPSKCHGFKFALGQLHGIKSHERQRSERQACVLCHVLLTEVSWAWTHACNCDWDCFSASIKRYPFLPVQKVVKSR
jgi:hypothetical protein